MICYTGLSKVPYLLCWFNIINVRCILILYNGYVPVLARPVVFHIDLSFKYTDFPFAWHYSWCTKVKIKKKKKIYSTSCAGSFFNLFFILLHGFDYFLFFYFLGLARVSLASVVWFWRAPELKVIDFKYFYSDQCV